VLIGKFAGIFAAGHLHFMPGLFGLAAFIVNKEQEIGIRKVRRQHITGMVTFKDFCFGFNQLRHRISYCLLFLTKLVVEI
jgi:hypothetical protein